MRKLVIVHLSDIHFNNTEESNILLANLIDDLQLMKREVGKYDLLAITGDCVDRGRVDLFEIFNKKVNGILKACGLKPKNTTIVVPGNHDISHDNVWLKSLKKEHMDNYEKTNSVIENDFAPLYKEYNEFVDKYSAPKNGIGVKYFTVNGLTIRAIFINSSWSTLTNNKYGQLVIGDKQIEEIKNKITSRKKKFDFTIACMHHPLDWFEYKERMKLQDFLYNTLKVDFLLHGHIHEASYDSLFNMDTTTNIFCTGISYTITGEKCSRKDGMRYSIYEIDKDTLTVNVYLRSTNKNGEFVGDNRLYSAVNKEGFFSIPIGNISECIMPIRCAKNDNKHNIFLSRNLVELLLAKEERLFRYYCGMEKVLEQMLVEKEQTFSNWKKTHKKYSKSQKEAFEKEFYLEQFELYCMHALINLNALFFEKHKDVRFLLRRYDPTSNKHVAILAEGINSTKKDLENTKNFTWGEGMIYSSYKCKAPLLKSKNLDCHVEGNSKDFWKEYLTIAIGGIEIKKARELIPLFALNIATNSFENEACLQALSLSSIYEKLQEVFKLFNYKAYDLVKLFEP